MHAKNASMSASVPTVPSWLKSADPQPRPGAGTMTVRLVAVDTAVGGLNSPTLAVPLAEGATLAVNRKLYIVPQRTALAFAFVAYGVHAHETPEDVRVAGQFAGLVAVFSYGSPLWQNTPWKP